MKYKMGFSQPKKETILGWIIKKVQGWDKATHSYIVFFDDRTGQEVVFHARWPVVTFDLKKDFIKDNIVFQEIPFSIENKDLDKEVWSIIYKNIGKPYSFLQLFYILFMSWTGRPPRSKDLNREFICTEILGILLSKSGDISRKDADLLTPKKAWDLAQKLK